MVHHWKWFWKNESGCLPSPIRAAGSQLTGFPAPEPLAVEHQVTDDSRTMIFLCWNFQNAGNFSLVAILNQSESKFQEHMKHMELPQNSGRCWVEILPSPRLVSACVTPVEALLCTSWHEFLQPLKSKPWKAICVSWSCLRFVVNHIQLFWV